MMLQSSIVARVRIHMLYPVWAHCLINQQDKKLVSLLTSLLQDFRRQGVKYRIYHLCNDDFRLYLLMNLAV